MQLEQGKRSILSYFPSSSRAQQAGKELKAAGFTEMQIDRISRYGFNADPSYDNPINNAETLSGLTHFSADGESRNTLLAADPSASGYGDRNYGIAGGRAFLLTLVIDDNRVEEAVGIIKKNGGTV